jgi:hypothetical protein
MARRPVSCINKRGNHYDAHERIQAVGGIYNGERYKFAEDDAIARIERRADEFYVSVNGRTVNVVVATHNSRKYLKTEADGYKPDNLLNLPECP